MMQLMNHQDMHPLLRAWSHKNKLALTDNSLSTNVQRQQTQFGKIPELKQRFANPPPDMHNIMT